MGNKLPAQLPVNESVFKNHAGKKYLPSSTLEVLPESRKASPGSLMAYYKALPPERRIMKGSSVSGEPNIGIHPNGDTVTYACRGFIVMLNLTTLRITKKIPDLVVLSNYCYTAVSPNGRYVGYVATLNCSSRHVALQTFAIDSSLFIKQSIILCHRLCTGFVTELISPTRPECRFSADSEYLATGSSRGQLFVVKRYKLSLHCSVIPGMFTHPHVKLSNERCFDFDPRFLHRYLTFADHNAKIYVCDINNSTVEMTISLIQDVQIQILLYSPTGRNLAVALSNGTISILDPDSLDLLYVLDATVQEADSNMVFTPQGALPTWIHMSYSTTGNLLATSATDGKIRVWQLEPDLSLQQLCTRALLQYVPMDKICRLPLPVKLIEQLLQWPQQ